MTCIILCAWRFILFCVFPKNQGSSSCGSRFALDLCPLWPTTPSPYDHLIISHGLKRTNLTVQTNMTFLMSQVEMYNVLIMGTLKPPFNHIVKALRIYPSVWLICILYCMFLVMHAIRLNKGSRNMNKDSKIKLHFMQEGAWS